ncbi:MAG: S8 family serine peptidase [Phycisphaerae bacterium]|nr:S8 family serine peptidase [Phycisphaerae bacterium]MDD5380824.1 S8 family serine peptidase [Phycisphaerae bacterium]
MKRQILVGSLILLFAAALAIADDSYKPGALLVRFANPKATTQAKNAVLSAISGNPSTNVVKEYRIVPGLALVQLPTGMTVKQMRVFAALSPDILYAEPVYKCRKSAVPNDARFSDLWGLHNTGQEGGTADADIDAPEAWDLDTGDGSVVVAVIDSGVDYTHSDLAANMWHNPGEIPGNGIDDDGSGFIDDYYGCDTGSNDANPMDDSADPGHGTHVSGIIGAVGNNGIGVTGVCWNVKIMAVKIAADDGTLYYNAAIDGIEYAVSKGAKVINASWYLDPSSGFPQALYDAIEAAENAGVLFVTGAANDDRSIDAMPYYPASYTLDNVISVMATSNIDEKAYYSNFGLISVDLAAPGGEQYDDGDPRGILSTIPGNQYEYYQGTSMAAPYVAGACALLWTADPNLTYTDVKGFLMDYSDPLASLTGLCATGGRLNLYNSLHEVLFDSTSPLPDPAEWEFVPQATGLHTIIMQAKEATDHSGVEYYFVCTDVDSGGPNPAFDSGWQDSTLYTRSDFTENTTYTFTVKYRDKSDNHNETAPSIARSAATANGTDNLPPFSNPSRWKIRPKVQRIRPTPRVGMEAMASTDENGPISYFFTCVDVDGTGPNPALDSGWITAIYTISSGLNVGSSYTFTVKARDFLLNETAESDQATVTISSEGGNLLTVPRPYTTIQDAVNAAVDGDTVEVRPGTYTGTGNHAIDFGGHNIIVRSMDPNDPATVAATVIDCGFENRAFYFHHGEDHNSVVTGFTIVNGLGMDDSGNPSDNGYGGAIACFNDSEPTITKCVIMSCFAAGNSGSNGDPGADGGPGANGDDYDATNGTPATDGDDGGDGGDGGDGDDGGSGFGGAFYFDSGSPEIRQCKIIACGALGGNGGTGGDGGNGGDGGTGGNGGNSAVGAGGGDGGDGGRGGRGGGGGIALGGAMHFGTACRPTIVECEITGCGVINGGGAAAGNGGDGGDGGNGGNGTTGGPGGTGGNGENGGFAGTDGLSARGGALYYAQGCVVTIADTIIRDNTLFINDSGTHSGGDGGNGGNGGNGGDGDTGAGQCGSGGDGGYGRIGGDGGEVGSGSGSCSGGLDRPDNSAYNQLNSTDVRGGGNYYGPDCIVGITACTISGNDAGGQNSFGIVGWGGGEFYERNCNSVFNNCKIEDNNASVDGGGIDFNSVNASGSATLNFCDITGNSASAGGGIFGGSVYGTFTINISDSNFRENDALFGGGIYLERTNLTIEDSILSGNTAFEGAGMWNYDCTTTVKGCSVKENEASFGGGFSLIESRVSIENTNLTGNQASSSFYGTGGALFFEGWSDDPHQITNCLITDNNAYAYGGGVSINRGSWVQINNCTLVGNDVIGPDGVGGAVSNAEFWAWAEIDNSILWGNRAEAGGSQIAVGNPFGSYPSGDGRYADVYVSNSDVQYGEGDVWLEDETQTYTALWWLGGNIDEEPLFASTRADEQTYFLSQIVAGQLSDSNCVDAGDGTASALDAIIGIPLTTRTDLVADANTNDIVDMGYHYPASSVVPQYEFTVEVVNQGYGTFGTVDVNLPPLILVSDANTYDVNQGRVIELRAEPNDGWEVYQWTGADYLPVHPTDQNYNTVTMNSDKTVTIEFGPKNAYKLVTHVIGDGTISPSGLNTYSPGTVVTLKATPANPSQVVIWTGTDDDLLDTQYNTVTMDAHKEVFAEFYSPRTLYVPGQYPSIQAAIDDADDRDIIELSAAPEPYYTQFGFEIYDKAITITSTNPDDPCCVANTIIQMDAGVGENRDTIFRFYGVEHNTILNGLTIRGFIGGGFTAVAGRACDDVNGPGSNGGMNAGGGISCYVASPTIKNCVISDCTMIGDNGGNGFNGCQDYPDGFPGGWPGRAYGGGAALFYNSSPIFINCVFRNNNAIGGNGGDGGSGNSAIPGPWGRGGPGGGWYYGEGSYWYNHDWPNGEYCDGGGCWFDLYTEYTGRGGAVYVGPSCSPEFIGCTFTNNKSFSGTNGICGQGGNPYSGRDEPASRYRIDNSGGAVYVAGASTAQFIDCVFNNNAADINNLPDSSDMFVSYGGAIAFEDEADLTFEGCTFNNNLATIGGGIYSSNSSPLIGDCNFLANSAFHGGGALLVSGTVNIDGTSFNENEATVTAGQGGGLCLLGTNAGIVDCNFANNSTRGSGGGIYFSNKNVFGEDISGDNQLLVKNCLITGNSASRDGGGISSNWYSEPNIVNCTIADNVVTGVGFEGGFGGGVYCSYSSYVNIINSILWGNSGNIGVQGSQLAIATGVPYDPRLSTVNVAYSDIQDANDPCAFGRTVEALDLVFCIDTTGSMADDIDAVKAAVNQITSAIVTEVNDYRIAVMDYRDFNETPYGSDETDYPYRDVLGFTTDTSLVANAINSLTAAGGGDTPESVYAALMDCINHNSLAAALGGQLHGASPASTGPGAWRTGAGVMRVILLMGDAEPHDPEPFTNYTVEDIIAASSGSDPVRIVSLMVGADVNATNYFERLAGETGGTFMQADSAADVVDAMLNAINMVSQTPDPIFVDVNCVLNWTDVNHRWDANSHNINADPCFIAGYYLSQVAAGQDINSPCINAGNVDANDPNIGLDTYTTRTDSFPDVNDPNYPDPNSAIVDMGYHYRLFIAPRYELLVTADEVPDLDSGQQPVVDPNGGSYYQYTVVHLNVSPNPPPSGYQVLWTGTDNDGLTGTENTVLMDRNRTGTDKVTVTFVRNVCDLTTGVIGYGGTIMPADGNYPRGAVVVLTASPNAGYRVKRWIGTDNDNSTSTNNTITMNGDKTVSVEFEQPVTITVPGDFSSLQQALDAAEEGDTVLIAPGTYTTSTGYYIHDSNIIISSIVPEDPCVVAATTIEMQIGDEGYISTSAFAIYNVGPETVLNGITIRGFVHQAYSGLPGDELGEDGYNGAHAFGGGIICYMASPTIKNCRFVDCSVIGGNGGNGYNGSGSNPDDPNINGTDGGWPGRAYGGGLACLVDSSPSVINCTFENCTATGGNGGDGGNGGTTEDSYGQGGRGGGWYYGESNREWYRRPWVNSSQGYERFGPAMNSFYDFYNEYSGRGGAVFIGEQCAPTFTHCTFINNRTEGGTCGITGLDGWPPQDREEPSIHWEIENFGGAVFCEANSTPVFTDCNFAGNTADTTYLADNDDPFVSYGGALAWEKGAGVVLESCKFSDNLAAIGGAMYGSDADAEITDCNISGNLAYQGGGFFGASGSATIQKCIVHNNFAGMAENNAGGQGGGIYSASMAVEISDSNISYNEANTSGGGLFLTGVTGSQTVMNCLITGNFAGRDGGGISSNWHSEPNIVNCTIANNVATGIGFGAAYGGGVYCSYGNYTNIVNSILWGNLSQNGPQLAIGTGFEYDPRPSTASVSYSDIEGGQSGIFIDSGCTLNWWGVTNLQADPYFVTGPLGSYYLSQIDTNDPNQTADSPCVEAGNDLASDIGLSYPYTTRTDEVFDTNVVDLGYHYLLAHPIEFCSFCDLSNDGDVDLVDFAIFALSWLDDGCSKDNNWCDGADFTFDSYVNFEDLNLFYECWISEDNEAPLPNPSKWKVAPHSTTTTPPYEISMTAEPAFDAWGGLVEYYFECVTGNADSNGWVSNTTYVITDLDPNTTYGFRVKARDERGHETQWSAIGYASTGQAPVEVDTTPPEPPTMTWASPPAAVPGSSTAITMTATTATDSSNPVMYYFECTSNGTFTSAWQINTTYLATGLAPSTLYTFTVKARDNAGPPNENLPSAPASATTNAEEGPVDNQAPGPVAWLVEPYETGSGFDARVWMTAVTATDAGGNGVWYQFECTDVSGLYSGDCGNLTDGYSSDWIAAPEWNNICIHLANQGHTFRFRVRDNLWNVSAWSSTLPAL